MNSITTDLDQTDREILIYDVSDEALEAAAGTSAEAVSSLYSTVDVSGCGCVD